MMKMKKWQMEHRGFRVGPKVKIQHILAIVKVILISELSVDVSQEEAEKSSPKKRKLHTLPPSKHASSGAMNRSRKGTATFESDDNGK